MELLSEFFNPIPMGAIIAAVFAIIFVLAITLIFRMPKGFAEKEQVRMELRFRLAAENEAAELAAKKEAEAEQEMAAKAEQAQGAPPEAGKPPEADAAKPQTPTAGST
jgi:hypothetical protein